MSHVLASHNDDIKRLIDKGYAVAFDENEYLVVRDVPYLDQDRKLCQGAIVSKFVDQGNNRIAQQDHQVFFAGGVPHGLDGKPIPNLGGGPTALNLGASSADVVVQRSFSNKPPAGAFVDFFAKVESYVNIIGGPAIELHAVSPLTFRTVEPSPSDSPFKFRDTLTSRAEIGDLNAKFHHDVVAIIGLGGTGAYVLDFIAKTPVREVRGFDHDMYHVHNAYRSPGRLVDQELGKPKAEVLQGRYENFRRGVTMKRVFVDASTKTELEGVTFAFVCVDKARLLRREGSPKRQSVATPVGLGAPAPAEVGRTATANNCYTPLMARPARVARHPVPFPEVMTISELAGYLQVSKSSLYKLVQAGKVPGQKVGRHWRFHRGAIDSWLKGRRRNPRKTPKTLEQREAQSGLDHAEDART